VETIQCAYLDGTSGIQCTLSMSRFKGFPSQAKIAHGDLETPGGLLQGRTFFFCIPAFMFYLARRHHEVYFFDDLIKEQQACSHYDTKRKIRIPKKYYRSHI